MSEQPNLEEGLGVLSKELSKYTSYKATLLRGIVYGVGTAIGASVIAAFVFGVVYRFIIPLVYDVPQTEVSAGYDLSTSG